MLVKTSQALYEYSRWIWPIDWSRYNCSPGLRPDEKQALKRLDRCAPWKRDLFDPHLKRLMAPLWDCCEAIEGRRAYKDAAVVCLLRYCTKQDLSYWGFNEQTWYHLLGQDQGSFFRAHDHKVDGAVRHYLAAIAYLLGCWQDFRSMGHFKREPLARKVFGSLVVKASLTVVGETIKSWGYSQTRQTPLRSVVCEAMLLNKSPHLEDLKVQYIDQLRRNPSISEASRAHLSQLRRVLESLSIIQPLAVDRNFSSNSAPGVHLEWVEWVGRWDAVSCLSSATRRQVRLCLFKAGRWLMVHHPEMVRPEQWTKDLCIAYVAAVSRMRVGDYTVRKVFQGSKDGQPLSPRSINTYLGSMRQFFRDCQEWDWISRGFDPQRTFATPRSIKSLIGPKPRTISDDIWAKLMWAGLNLSHNDLPGHGAESGRKNCYYPIEMVRAIAVVWLFTGLRGDEIVRLRPGCIRKQDGSDQTPCTEHVCLLDVPVHKTGRSYTKPVDKIVGEAIATWEAVRPHQPKVLDRKTGEAVDLLFCYRGRPLTRDYINGSLIPMLCAKAKVPLKDARGNISSHRARATIASQLFNAKEPMSLFELQTWLGHSSPTSTQHYVACTPIRLAKSYAKAGYLERNVRAIEVLIDQEAIRTGAAATGQPWRYYDLSHGYCSYDFFEQCPHRLACARCNFYIPKDSSKGQLLESRESIQRLLREAPLREEERAAAKQDFDTLGRIVSAIEDKG